MGRGVPVSDKSDFNIEVVNVTPEMLSKHPNADSLSIVRIGDYPVIVRTADFAEPCRAVYVPVDAIVPTSRPEFSFLSKSPTHRIRAAKLRGTFSMGLLVRTDAELHELGIEKYIPPSELALLTSRPGSPKAKRKGTFMLEYGLDSLRKTPGIFAPGEEVVITEKIHGCNARYCFRGGQLHVGSHRSYRGCTPTRWADAWNRLRLRVLRLLGRRSRTNLFETAGDVWWEIADRYELRRKLEMFPGLVVYGEIYGPKVQDLQYDADGRRKFRVFDVYGVAEGRWLSYDEVQAFCLACDLTPVPELYRGPWSEGLKSMAEGKSTLGDHVREGIVVRTVEPGPTAKFVGEGYYLRTTGD